MSYHIPTLKQSDAASNLGSRKDSAGARIRRWRRAAVVVSIAITVHTAGAMCTTTAPVRVAQANSSPSATSSPIPSAVRPSPRGPSIVHEISPQDLLKLISSSQAPALVVHFWATWCPPCLKEFPLHLSSQKRFSTRGVEWLFVSADDPEDRAEVEQFLKSQLNPEQRKRRSMTLLLTHHEDSVQKLFSKDWQGGLPASLFYGAGGHLVSAKFGSQSETTISSEIESLLALRSKR